MKNSRPNNPFEVAFILLLISLIGFEITDIYVYLSVCRNESKAKKITMAKKKVKNKVSCIECKNAYLMRSSKYNPIVAECMITKERYVAEVPAIRDCRFEKNNDGIKINEMIFLNVKHDKD